MENNNQDLNREYHDVFPTPILSTMIPVELSNVIPDLFDLELLGKEEGVSEKEYGLRTKNSYILTTNTKFRGLHDHILKYAVDFAYNYGLPYNEFKFSQSWLSVKQPGQFHTVHTHPNSVISGVFYFGPSDEKTPAIRFHPYITPGTGPTINMNQQHNTSKYTMTSIDFNFVAGQLLLFPSSLQHSVPTNETELPRYSLAFNIVPTHGFGEESSLTELKFN